MAAGGSAVRGASTSSSAGNWRGTASLRSWPTTARTRRRCFPGFVEDGARAVAWAQRHAGHYGGDASRLFVAGHSAGAQIAALLGTDPVYLDAHGLSPTQLAGVIGLAGPYDFDITGRYRAVFGPPSQWPQAQAVRLVTGDEPPFLLVHGEADRVVDARDSLQLAQRLRQAGGEATVLMLPDAGHSAPILGLYDPKRAPEVLPAILSFVHGAHDDGEAAPDRPM